MVDYHWSAARENGPETHTAHSFISQLSLTLFRNHVQFTLQTGNEPVVLIGDNGAGKTNILEAISLLTPGRGLRSVSFSDMANKESGQGWTMFTEIECGGDANSIGMSYTPGEEAQDKRLIKINGTQIRSQQELSDYLSVIWLTPEMSHMFTEGNSARRRFLDRLAASFDPEHTGRIAAYEHCTRERNRLLGMPRAEPAWLHAIEKKMSEYSVAIAAVRLMTVERLQHAINEATTSFPKPRLAAEGEAEYMLRDGMTALAIEEWLEEKLSRIRDEDRQSGRSGAGAHRTTLRVHHTATGREAGDCSTGQQKALLTSIILGHARARRSWQGSAPILLLDEAVAHLDQTRRSELFGEIHSLSAQAWLTGTDAADFAEIVPRAQFLKLEN
ncbi:MAG: DNA replication/repair protein RecF [Rickettsiales bacterium]